MKRNRIWLIGLTFITTIALIFGANLSQPHMAQISAQAQPQNIAQSSSSLALYQDPNQRFQIGILEGYQVTAVANNPLITSPDGDLAYTVVVRPRATASPLSDASLAQVAIDTFRQGEGFVAQDWQIDPDDGIRISWSGSVTIGRTQQPMGGVILARQVPEKSNILLLLIAATESAANDVEPVLNALTGTFGTGL